MTITTWPSVRGDAVLLASTRRGTWHGYESDWVLAAAGLCVDACLSGVIEVTGGKTFGLDRRRVVAGPAALDDDLVPMLGRLGRRCALVAPENPWEWIRHASTFAPEGVLAELSDDGAGDRFEGRWHPFGRTAGLVDVDERVRSDALDRVQRACASGGESAQAAATALLLQSTDALHHVLPGARSRAVRRNLASARERLPLSARQFVDVVADRAKARDRIGGY